MGFPHEALPAHPKDEALFNKIDHVLAEESLILAGLSHAVHAGYITEDEKSEWLSEFIDKRNAGDTLPNLQTPPL